MGPWGPFALLRQGAQLHPRVTTDDHWLMRSAHRALRATTAPLREYHAGLKLPNYPDHRVSVKYATEHRCGIAVGGCCGVALLRLLVQMTESLTPCAAPTALCQQHGWQRIALHRHVPPPTPCPPACCCGALYGPVTP